MKISFFIQFFVSKTLDRAEDENSIDAIAFGIGRAKKFRIWN